MAALERVLKDRPQAHAVIVGADRVAYGKQPEDGKSYKTRALEDLDLDLDRVHFTGLLPRDQYRQVLQASSVHVYLTAPFVLSWSMMEAMSAGCLIVGSDTAPVREMIEDGRNGLLVDFFDIEAIAGRICEALDRPGDFAPIRAAARATILKRYAASDILAQRKLLIESVASGLMTA
ncbi:MAG: glycosyltransferase [Pseudomonadota bacterium]